jgi:hypothetical protein
MRHGRPGETGVIKGRIAAFVQPRAPRRLLVKQHKVLHGEG